MNYYEARQRNDGDQPLGIWHFTRMNDKQIWPDGCDESCTHSTPEEACQHRVELWIADGVHLVKTSWTSCDVEGCENPAQQGFDIGREIRGYVYCDEHASEERAIEQFRADHIGTFSITSSY